MTHVVTERCVDCRYTDCCAVCPADCFLEVKNPAMLVIDPVTCIDCGLCIPECPIYAIYPLAEVPDPYKEWVQKNADLVASGTTITEQTEALPSAIPLDEIHAREKGKGWSVKDPSAVSDGGGGEAGGAGAAPAAAVAAAPPPPPRAAAAGAATGEKVRVRIPKAPRRALIDVHPGGRLKVRHRTGRVLEMRKMKGDIFNDVLIHLDGDHRPTWFLYSALQTLRDQGELEVLERGQGPGLFARLLGG
jgi:ferredoxin